MRWVAKNVVAAGLAERCEVAGRVRDRQGRSRSACSSRPSAPSTVPDDRIQKAVAEVFDLRPAAIIRDLDLLRPIYSQTAAYGHFGRELPDFTWERTDRADELKSRRPRRAVRPLPRRPARRGAGAVRGASAALVDHGVAVGGTRDRSPAAAAGRREPAAVDPVARVVVDVPLAHLDRPFDYLVPARAGRLGGAGLPGAGPVRRPAGRRVPAGAGRRQRARRPAGVRGAVVSAEPVLSPAVAALARAVADR